MEQTVARRAGADKNKVSGRTFFGHPRGLSVLFFTEMWERFSYYGTRALLILFMTAAPATGGLGFDVVNASAIYGLYTSMVYLLSLPGGWIADRFIGQRQAVFYGGILIAAGNFLLAIHSLSLFFVGLLIVTVGTGLLKPNVSTMVGHLYAPGDARRDAGFSIFYMGINLGAFLSPLACGYLGQRINWRLGFALAGIGMTLGTVQYLLGRKYLGDAGLHPTPAETPEKQRRLVVRFWAALRCAVCVIAVVAAMAISGSVRLSPEVISDVFGVGLLLTVLGIFAWLLLGRGWTAEERKRLVVVIALFIAATIFWFVFEQQGSTLSLFAERNTDKQILGYSFPASWFQSLNALFIVSFAPVFAWLWIRMGSAEPSSPAKFVLALLCAGSRVCRIDRAGYDSDDGRTSKPNVACRHFSVSYLRGAVPEPGGFERDDQTGSGTRGRLPDGRLVSFDLDRELSWRPGICVLRIITASNSVWHCGSDQRRCGGYSRGVRATDEAPGRWSEMSLNITEIQQALRDEGVDGWLFFDHHQRDPLAYKVLRFSPPRTPTRRWYYFIPANGEPKGLVHGIEPGMLDALPGQKSKYSSWRQQQDGLAALLAGARAVVMQYSPQCAVPYVAMVDAGTVELVKGAGVEVRSSANLVQHFEARCTKDQLESHLEAGRRVDEIRRRAFTEIGTRLRAGQAVSEWDIKKLIVQSFAAEGLLSDHGPIVGVNANASNPHYEPFEDATQPIRPGDWVLIDLWAKLDQPDSVFYDITWTGYCGDTVPSRMAEIFEVVRGARDRAVERVQRAVSSGEILHGFDVDDAARGFIQSKGYGDYFIHRTGHSIGREIHGTGANMDNLETHDDRRIIPWTCFSVEPGIYLPEFGVRSEVNVFVLDDRAIVTGEVQQAPVLAF